MDYPNVSLWEVSHLLCLQQDCFSDPTLPKAPTACTPPEAAGQWPAAVTTAPPAVGTAANGVETTLSFQCQVWVPWPGPA